MGDSTNDVNVANVSNTSIQTLELHNSPSIDVDHLVSILKTTPSIHTLDLRHCNIRSCVIDLIVGIIVESNSIKSVNLCGNPINNISNISTMLSKNRPLLKLDLSCTGLVSTHVTVIMNSLSTNSTLQKLNLSCNYINDDCTTYVAAILGNNKSLQSLNLSDNHIGSVGINKIMTSLHTNHTLCSLKLCGNFFGRECCQPIATILTVNNSLKKLGLRDILILNDNIDVIMASLQNNFTLTKMCIGFDDYNNNIKTNSTLKTLLQRNKEMNIQFNAASFSQSNCCANL